MQTDNSRVAKIWLIMMWLIVLSPIIVILFVKLETPLTGRGEPTVFLVIGGFFIAIPLILIGIASICARGLAFLSRVGTEQHSAKDTPLSADRH
jgi:hypothetical protein